MDHLDIRNSMRLWLNALVWKPNQKFSDHRENLTVQQSDFFNQKMTTFEIEFILFLLMIFI